LLGLTALVPYLVFYVLPIAIWKQGVYPSGFGILLITLIPLGMGYAVVTTKLMDIDVVVRRGIVYGIVTIIMTIILSIGILVVVSSPSSLTAAEQIGVALLLGIAATALFGPVKKGIESLVDKLFYKDRYDYRLIVQSLSLSLNSVKEFSDISRLIVGTAVHALNLAGGCLFIKTQTGNYALSTAEGELHR